MHSRRRCLGNAIIAPNGVECCCVVQRAEPALPGPLLWKLQHADVDEADVGLSSMANVVVPHGSHSCSAVACRL
jgi:hypothetical protein